jgi:N-acetylmuramoyl-L-alanine amidase
VARATSADAFVSIHFNGFGDTTAQGTETCVHESGSPRSVDLAGCVQRAVLQATRHRDRGVKRKVLGVVNPANHAPGTAACLAELSFITTTAEDARLHDPEYLQALGLVAATSSLTVSRLRPSARRR